MDFFERIRQIKAEYPTGTRIQLDHMDDPYSPVPDGTKGTVSFVDDMGTLHMIWDNGRTLGVCPEVDDFHKIGGERKCARFLGFSTMVK